MRNFKTREAALASLARLRERGEALADRVCHVEGTRYRVPSSVPGQAYEVDLARETCTCPHYPRINAHREGVLPNRCKHIWGVILYRQKEKKR